MTNAAPCLTPDSSMVMRFFVTVTFVITCLNYFGIRNHLQLATLNLRFVTQ